MTNNDRIAGRVTHYAQQGCTIGYIPRVTLSLSNLSFFIPGRAEQLCASDHTNCHTFGSREASLRLMTLTILPVEPRASLSGTRRTACTRSVGQHCISGMVVYPGVYRVVYTGRHIPGTYREVYPREAYTPFTPWVYHLREDIHPVHTLGIQP